MSTPEFDLQPGLFQVRLGLPDQPVDLSLLEQLAERIRGAFREIVRERTGDTKAQIRLLVRDAHKGSIVLSVEPELTGEDVPSVAEVARALISDINSLAANNARPNMSANLMGQYREMVKIGQRAGGLKLGYDGASSTVGPDSANAFEAAIREQLEAGVQMVGTIETVNIHSRPWTFGLYTKFDRQRLDCRFSDSMLEEVLRLLDAKTLVQVTGEARFAQVGITPRVIELLEPPLALPFDADALRSYRRSADIASEGETAEEAILRVREENAKFG